MNDNFSIKKINAIVRKLRFHDGDIILVKSGTPLAESSTMEFIIKELGKAGFKRGLVLAVPDFNDLKVLDEKDMSKNGWFHVDALAKLVQKKKEAGSDDTRQDAPNP